MVLLEVLPSYFPDGLKGLTRKLPFYKDVGFNTVYLMPHWLGGYTPIDPYKVDPALGTEDDLKEMVRTAHSLGMRVLFDMVIHGFNPNSDILRLHPEFFARDGFGAIVKHQTWDSMTTDPANPAYQQYIAELAVHDIKTYGIDGYRVDANAYKLPNWDPQTPYSPGYSSAAIRQLMQKTLAAMQGVKPGSILLSEIFGPVWDSICNVVHDDTNMGSQVILEMMDRGEVMPEQYKEHLARIVDVLPAGALRVRFARNHDTSWFYHFNGYTPRFLAMDAVHTMFGAPEVFAGDRKNPPDPAADPAVFGYYRKLFAARNGFPELTEGEVLLRGVESGNPWVIAGARRLNGKTVAILVSFSEKEEPATLSIEGTTASFQMMDPIAGSRVPVTAGVVKLKPFQVLLGRP
jgi:glycosidase